MSVVHTGYAGDGVEHYEARRSYSQHITLRQLEDEILELRAELFSHRDGMDVVGSADAEIRPGAGLWIVVAVRGTWVDQEAREAERSQKG